VTLPWWTSDAVLGTGSVFGIQAGSAFAIWMNPVGNTAEALCIKTPP
jgi:hypothetical protein